jgi:CBS domain-containing protein
MQRYGQEYGRPSTPGWRRPDLGSRPGHSRYRGRPEGELYFDEAREPWAPRYQGYGYPQESGHRQGSRGGGAPWNDRSRNEQSANRAGRGGQSSADRMRVSHIMTHQPEAVTPDTTLHEVAQRMRDLDVGIIPVVDDKQSRRLRGVITDRDIAVRAVADGEDITKAQVSGYMTSDVESLRENDSIRDVFDLMKRSRVRRVPVTGADGKLVGIVAQADLATSYAGLDFEREVEVEEVIERISEPGGGRRRYGSQGGHRPHADYDRQFTDRVSERVRDGWQTLRREARQLLRRGYDRDW